MKNTLLDTNIGTASGNGSLGSATQATVLPRPLRHRSRRQWLVVLALLFSDILLSFFSCGLTVLVLLSAWWTEPPMAELLLSYVLQSTAIWVVLRALLSLYPGYGLAPPEELRRQTYAAVATLAMTAIFAFSIQVGDLLPRLLVGLHFLELLLLAPVVRHFVKRGLARIDWWGKPVVVLGAGETGAQLMRTLQSEYGVGLKPSRVFDFRLAPRGGVLEGVPYGGTVTDALEHARSQGIDTVVFAMPNVRREYLAKFVDRASLYFPHVLVTPNLGGVVNSAVQARELAGTFALEIKYNLANPWAKRAKRALDLFGVVVGGLLISPLLLAIAILVKLDSPGPVLYKHKRLGAEGNYFYCWKFRTMRSDAAKLLTELLRSDPELRAEWEEDHKLRHDPRITRVGRFLRKSSLDELPQLWNVLRGQMSLIGPRPIVDEEISRYKEGYELYQRVKPGMSGLWQVSGRNGTRYQERVAIDVYYVRNWSVWLDLVILARTVGSVLFRRGAY